MVIAINAVRNNEIKYTVLQQSSMSLSSLRWQKKGTCQAWFKVHNKIPSCNHDLFQKQNITSWK